jgi:hypothetical protein
MESIKYVIFFLYVFMADMIVVKSQSKTAVSLYSVIQYMLVWSSIFMCALYANDAN